MTADFLTQLRPFRRRRYTRIYTRIRDANRTPSSSGECSIAISRLCSSEQLTGKAYRRCRFVKKTHVSLALFRRVLTFSLVFESGRTLRGFSHNRTTSSDSNNKIVHDDIDGSPNGNCIENCNAVQVEKNRRFMWERERERERKRIVLFWIK